jgi:hypothetical protein
MLGVDSAQRGFDLPPALLINLPLDAADDSLVVSSNSFRLIWIATVFTYKRLVWKIIVSQKYRGPFPRFLPRSQTVQNLTEIETADLYLKLFAHNCWA